MKHTDLLNASSHCSANSSLPKLFNHQLTEGDILSLQDAFLTNGTHQISFTNKIIGRHIITDFLGSLALYSNIGYLTLDLVTPDIPEQCIDIYSLLCPYNEQAIEEFFINEFYFDFVWIEVTPELTQAPWYGYFCKIMEAYNQGIPILKATYQNRR